MWMEQSSEFLEATRDSFVLIFLFQSRIIGGSAAQPNEYVSVAGLVDISQQNQTDGPIFCGAAISEKNTFSYDQDDNFYLIFS